MNLPLNQNHLLLPLLHQQLLIHCLYQLILHSYQLSLRSSTNTTTLLLSATTTTTTSEGFRTICVLTQITIENGNNLFDTSEYNDYNTESK